MKRGTGIASLIAIATAALCTPQRADANTVHVTVTGAVYSGFDQNGAVFGSADLTGANFMQTYTLTDQYGQSCGSFSCIQQTIYPNTYPMTSITLSITGKTFSGTFTFENSQFHPTDIIEMAYRRLNVAGHPALIYFNHQESYSYPYGDGSSVTTGLYVDLDNLSPCWEGKLPSYTPDDTDTGERIRQINSKFISSLSG
jgi:hypothetical protein